MYIEYLCRFDLLIANFVLILCGKWIQSNVKHPIKKGRFIPVVGHIKVIFFFSNLRTNHGFKFSFCVSENMSRQTSERDSPTYTSRRKLEEALILL